LKPIETEQVALDDGGVRFLVRMVSSLKRKETDKRQRNAASTAPGKPRDPFLPPEPELTVADVSSTHIAVLNKFNVLDHHLLIVTRAFEHQDALLTIADFRALFVCMAEYEGLGFYNGGTLAGASQPHKHLQLIPLPLDDEGEAVPMEPLLGGRGPFCPGLPFSHAFGRLANSIKRAPFAAAEEACGLYMTLLAYLGIGGFSRRGEARQSAPYNLLIAHDWMLVVPRVEELFRGISVNSLGFAGSLFVKDPEQLELIRAEGPMRVLRAVTESR